MTGWRQLAHRLVAHRFQPIEDHFEANVAGGNLGLIDVIQLQSLGQGKDVLLAIVAGQGGAERLQRRVTTRVALGCQNIWITFSGNDGADDPHTRGTRNIGHDVMELQVHLRQRLLHVLNVSCGVVQQPFPLAQISS